MACDLSLTPSGRLILIEPDSSEIKSRNWLKKLCSAFSSSQSRGLFTLAADKPDVSLSPSLAYWRQFSSRYLIELCRLPEFSSDDINAIAPPPAELEKMASSVPPMRGAEYLSVDMLITFWSELDSWARKEISSCKEGMAGWLKDNAPLWHQVGRVCFHLAENKRDNEYPFAFLATYAPQVSRGGQVQYQPLSKALQEYAGERNRKALVKLLSPVHLASERSEFVRELVESNDVFHPLKWTPQEAYRFLKETPALEESGILVRSPDWWRKRPRPRATVTIGENKANRLGTDMLLDFKVDILLGDSRLTKKELEQLLSADADDGLMLLKGQWVEIDRERLSQALAHWKEVEKEASAGGISFIEGMRLLAGASNSLEALEPDSDQDSQWSYVNAGSWLSSILSDLRDPSRIEAQSKINGFQGTLRPYQKTGHNWLSFLSSLGLGACLADDMGLGKTVQILSLLLTIKERKSKKHKPSLLVLPASLVGNWKAEIERFAPSLSACFIHPSESSLADLDAVEKDPDIALADKDLVLTTYGMVLRQSWLTDVDWRLVILDEAQAIKNPSAQQTRAVKKLKSEARIALTGTPVENRLSDLWSLFDFLSPGLLGSAAKFKQFTKELEAREHDRYAPLRNLVSPYILRRLKTDKSIITDLPDKTELKAFCGLSKKQISLYSKAVSELARIIEEVEGIKRRGLVLSYLLRFKQICNHPSQLTGDGAYASLDSGKFERLKAICEEVASRQEKVLVFTQFREMTDPIASFLADVFGESGLVLHGGTAVKRRKKIVDDFQREDGPPFVVLSLKAGGTGLNLTAASHVVHFDRWWNPAVENQATDRVYRIGQHRNVLVHKFICRGTVEEKIDALIEEKTELADGILKGGAESMLTELSDKELIDIVSLDIERASTGER